MIQASINKPPGCGPEAESKTYEPDDRPPDQPQGHGQRGLRGRHVHDDHGYDDCERRAAHHLPRTLGAAQPGGRRIHRIPGQPGGIHPGLGLAGRPVRLQTGLSGRPGHLHGRLGAVFLPEHREAGVGRFDLPGFLLAGTGLGALMYALSEGPYRGWTSPLIVSLGLAGIVLLAGLVWTEKRTPQPIVRLRLLADRLFASTTAVMFTGMMAFLGSL